MKDVAEIKTYILNKLSLTNQKIRMIEDESQKYSLAPSSNGAYVGLVGYREALRDLLNQIGGSWNGRESD